MKTIKKSLLTRILKRKFTYLFFFAEQVNILQQIIKCKEIVLNTHLNLNYEKTDEK